MLTTLNRLIESLNKVLYFNKKLTARSFISIFNFLNRLAFFYKKFANLTYN